MSTRNLELAAGDARLTVSPATGGVAGFRIGAAEVLSPHLAHEFFPMAPWCGRMRDGVLRWGGHDYLFPHTEGPHAIHGMVRRRPWTVAEHSASEVVLVQELARPWPFPGRATQSIALGDDSATFRMMVDPDHCSIGEMTWNRRGLAGPLGTTAVTS